MRKISFILIILIAFLASCTKNFEDFNENEINPSEVPGEALFTNAQIEIADQVASANVNLNIWKLWAQYWTETTYTDEANYDIVNRTIADWAFLTWYRDILRDLKVASELIAESEIVLPEDEIIKANKLQIINLLEVYSYKRLVDIFGAAPYGEALDIENITPAYQDGFAIYQDLIRRLEEEIIPGLDENQGSFSAADLYYQGNVSKWKKFAHGLLLDLGIMLSDVEPGLAESTISNALGGLLESNADNASLHYLTSSPYTNPIHEDLVLSGRRDFVAANTLVDAMDSLNDPRMDQYFDPESRFDTVNGTPKYVGGQYGYPSAFSLHSQVNPAILDPSFPVLLYSYVEQQFYRAEAAARGFTGENAEEMYYSAIRASFSYWGLSTSQADQYINQPEVQWDEGNWKQLIAVQSWIAYYMNGFDGYTVYRRLDYPEMNIPEDPYSDCISEETPVPTRFTFPINEQTLNEMNYGDAVGLIGGTDGLCTRIFWDVE